MLRRLGGDEIRDYGDRLHLGLSPAEARILEARMAQLTAAFETFDDLRIPEERPSSAYLERDPGRCPTEEEDPLAAFIRICRVRGAQSGPLAGKRIGLKDHIAVAGIPMSLGVRFMERYVPDFDATVVTRLLDAGGTVVGKTNMDGFSFGGYGWGGVGQFGRTKNPRDTAFLTGGSSQGSAAAVAAGLVDVGLGGDQAGSIRLPASWCGVVGLKATHGLIPHTGVVGLDPVLDYVGPLTRTVEETAITLAALAGEDGYDPRQRGVPAELPDYVRALRDGVEGLRIGVLTEGFGFEGSDPKVEDCVRDALRALERLGAIVEEVSVPLHELATLALLPLLSQGTKLIFDTNLGGAFAHTYYPVSLMTTIGAAKQTYGHELPPNIKLHLIAGAYLQDACQGRLYAKSQNLRPTFVRQYEEAFARVDVLATPTCPFKPLRVRELGDYEEALEQTIFGAEDGIDLEALVRNTAPFNYTGHPALSIPCGRLDGLPIGLQLTASFFREDLLLRVAHAYEQTNELEATTGT